MEEDNQSLISSGYWTNDTGEMVTVTDLLESIGETATFDISFRSRGSTLSDDYIIPPEETVFFEIKFAFHLEV